MTDRVGRRVNGLPQSAFTVSEEGRPQRIAQFATEALPFSLAVALDTSSSMRGERFAFARRALWDVVDAMADDDELTIIGFNDTPYVIAPWTRSRSLLAMAMSDVEPRASFGSTSLYGAVSTGLKVIESGHTRRRALLVISDGNDELPGDRTFQDAHHALPLNLSSGARLRELTERVRRSEALVYAIGIESSSSRQLPLDRHALRSISDPTGGFTVTVAENRDIAPAAQRVVDELRSQYLLAFVPEHAADDQFHKIDVQVTTCACRTRARAGYVHRR